MLTGRIYGGRFGGAFRLESRTTVAVSSALVIHTYEVVQYPRYPLAGLVSGAIAPVLNPNSQIIQNFESLWHYPWSEPVRFKVDKRRQIAEIVSGPFAPVLNPNTQIIQNFESRWHQPWSEPIRISYKRGHKAHEQMVLAWHPRLIPAANVTITVSAADPPVTDTAAMDVDATETPPFIDQTAVNVSIEEVSAQSGGNLSLTEGEG